MKIPRQPAHPASTSVALEPASEHVGPTRTPSDPIGLSHMADDVLRLIYGQLNRPDQRAFSAASRQLRDARGAVRQVACFQANVDLCDLMQTPNRPLIYLETLPNEEALARLKETLGEPALADFRSRVVKAIARGEEVEKMGAYPNLHTLYVRNLREDISLTALVSPNRIGKLFLGRGTRDKHLLQLHGARVEHLSLDAEQATPAGLFALLEVIGLKQLALRFARTLTPEDIARFQAEYARRHGAAPKLAE